MNKKNLFYLLLLLPCGLMQSMEPEKGSQIKEGTQLGELIPLPGHEEEKAKQVKVRQKPVIVQEIRNKTGHDIDITELSRNKFYGGFRIKANSTKMEPITLNFLGKKKGWLGLMFDLSGQRFSSAATHYIPSGNTPVVILEVSYNPRTNKLTLLKIRPD